MDPQLALELERASASGHYMVAVWRVEAGQLHFWRLTREFPVADFDNAQMQLRNDLAAERTAPQQRLVLP